MSKLSDWSVTFHWNSGFVEQFNIDRESIRGKRKAAEEWYEQGMGLQSIESILITGENGEILYKEDKKSL